MIENEDVISESDGISEELNDSEFAAETSEETVSEDNSDVDDEFDALSGLEDESISADNTTENTEEKRMPTALDCKVLPPCPECHLCFAVFTGAFFAGFGAALLLATKKEDFSGIAGDTCTVPRFKKVGAKKAQKPASNKKDMEVNIAPINKESSQESKDSQSDLSSSQLGKVKSVEQETPIARQQAEKNQKNARKSD